MKNVNSATASLSKELKQVNSLLKLDPKNTELLNQKQSILNKEIQLTSTKLEELKKHQEDVANSGVTLTEEQQENYRALQREILKIQTKLSDLKNENSKWNKAGDYLTNLGDELDNVSKKIDSLGSKLTTRLTLPITAVATAGISYNAEIEKMTTAFTTFLGDAKEAERVVENIKNNAAKTPFDVTSLIQANQMLISTGENAEDAQEVIMALGDAITATGGGNSELERMSANLQQIKNAGKATALDIKQFAYAGIDIYGLLAKSMGKTTAQIKDMDISYEDLTKALKKANKEGGKYYKAMDNASETLTGQVNQLKSEFKDMTGQLTKSLMPTSKKLVSGAKDLINKFDNLSDSQKDNIVKIGLMVAAAGPLLKVGSSAISIVGNVTSGIGTLTKAIGLAHNGIGTATGSAATLAKVLQGLTSPAGLAAAGITASVGIIVTAMQSVEKETKKSLSNVGNAATDFIRGIDTATSYLDSFNSTLFASAEEQQELENQMNEIQNAITKICKTASDERRDYTQEEVKQLEEYFNKLRDLKNRELEIQQSIAKSIAQQAEQQSQTFEGSLEEYQVLSQEWIKTAQEQAETEIKIINDRTTEEIALLQQRYGEKATLDNEEYAREYKNIMDTKDMQIQQANDQVARVNQAFSKGYLERTQQEDGFYTKLKEYYNKQEEESKLHNKNIEEIQNERLMTNYGKNQAIEKENNRHRAYQGGIWKHMYEDMDKSQEEQLGTWLAMIAETEMYGGELDDKTKEIADSIIQSFDDMPKGTKKAMKNAMEPMLTEMENKEPSLYAKASGIANGILSRLKKSFDIHSPSRETRDIFQNVMKGAEIGLDDEQNKLNKQVDTIANQMKTNFANMLPNMGAIKQSVIDQTKTVFTTPSIIINAQDELTPAKINSIIDTVNRRLGSQY